MIVTNKHVVSDEDAKYTIEKMEQKFLSIHDKSMQEQHDILAEELDNWKSLTYIDFFGNEQDYNGETGDINKKDDQAIDRENKKCSDRKRLYCVEQVCPNGKTYDISGAVDSNHGVCE